MLACCTQCWLCRLLYKQQAGSSVIADECLLAAEAQLCSAVMHDLPKYSVASGLCNALPPIYIPPVLPHPHQFKPWQSVTLHIFVEEEYASSNLVQVYCTCLRPHHVIHETAAQFKHASETLCTSKLVQGTFYFNIPFPLIARESRYLQQSLLNLMGTGPAVGAHAQAAVHEICHPLLTLLAHPAAPPLCISGRLHRLCMI